MGLLIVGAVVGVLLIDLLIRIPFVRIVVPVFEKMPPFGVQPAQADPNAETIEIPTTHGLTLQGSLYRQKEQAPRGVIVFCPELGGNHWMALSYLEGLWKAGFDILAFDFRNQGESERMPGYDPLHWLTEYEVSDALAVLAWVRRQDELRDLPLGFFGVSRGGVAALAAAARSPDVCCVACDSAFSTDSLMAHYAERWAVLYVPGWFLKLIPAWHIKVTLVLVRWCSQIRKLCRYTVLERWLPKLRHKPVFLVAGSHDSYVNPRIAEELSRGIGPHCRVWVVPKAKHNMARQIAQEEYDRRMVAFFSEATATAPERTSCATSLAGGQ